MIINPLYHRYLALYFLARCWWKIKRLKYPSQANQIRQKKIYSLIYIQSLIIFKLDSLSFRIEVEQRMMVHWTRFMCHLNLFLHLMTLHSHLIFILILIDLHFMYLIPHHSAHSDSLLFVLPQIFWFTPPNSCHLQIANQLWGLIL